MEGDLMKKRLLCMGLAISFVMANTGSLTFAGEDWTKGWTGKAGSTNYSIEADGSTVTIANTKANNGKFSDGEDSIIYYAQTADSDSDFELSATVNIDEYDTLEESSNPQQGSVGIAVLDSLYNKTDDISFDDGLFVGSYGEKKDSDLAICAITRDGTDTKSVVSTLSDSFKNQGTNLGSFDLKIVKKGSAYTLSCGDNSTTVEMNNLEDEVYPCLYIARNVKATFTNVSYSVDSRKAVSLELSGSCKTEYTYGEEFDTTGLKGTVTYDDGSKETTDQFLVSGFNGKKAGTQAVTLSVGSASATVEAVVKNVVVTDLDISYEPVYTKYANGGALDTEGMQVVATYDNGKSEIVDSSDYTLKLNDKTVKDGTKLTGAGKKELIVALKPVSGVESTKTAKLNIEVAKNAYSKLEVTSPDKTVYYLGDKLDTTGMVVKATYVDDKGKDVTKVLKDNEYEIKGYSSDKAGTKTLKVSAGNASAEVKVEVKERKAEKISLAKYPRTTYAVGEEFDSEDMAVVLNYDNGEQESYTDYTVDTSSFDTSEVGKTSVKIVSDKYGSVELPVTVVEEMDNKWRKSTFGQSSGYDKPESTSVTVDEYGTVNGTINVRSWDGTGKITNDHDGMTYYYTAINGSDDFKLSADIKVNKYLEHDNDDTKRNGQEAFGIMAKDVVPLSDADGNMTTDITKAAKDEEGVYKVNENSTVFASNMVILGGYSGTGWPSDQTSASYEKNTKINRINLIVRDGVTAVDGGGTRIGPYALSDEFPKEGNSYRLTLERMNGGIYARCYDYQTQKTTEKYYYDDSFLTTQNKDVAYVGFFTARWADIDVSNVEFYETARATDQKLENNEETAKTPAMYFRDKVYSTSDEYKFKLDVDDSYGTVTIKLNDKIVAQDEPISDVSEFTAKLNIDSVNKLVAVYTPSKSLNLTSYEPIIIRENIYHKNIDEKAETLYASPEGSFDGDGTEAKPFDIDTAIGFVQPGQTVHLAGGVYKRTTPIEVVLGDDGRADAVKTVEADENARAIIDGDEVSAGVVMAGSYWKFKNIDVTNCADNQKAFHLAGSHNVLENCKFYGNRDIGMQISRGSAVQKTKDTWPSYNTILNCESYNNCDPSMINADGFGAKLTVGEGNKFIGCKSHHNVDDGWDLYTKVNSGAIGAVTLENCESYKNGYKLNADGTEEPYNAGGNNGFKLGGENVGVQHVLINCKAYDNEHNGITTNSNPMLKLVNVQSYNNKASNIRLYSDKPEDFNYDVQGIVSVNGGEDDVVATLTQDLEYTNASATPLKSDANYWYIEGSSANASGEAGKIK
jgi:hypothetical protein